MPEVRREKRFMRRLVIYGTRPEEIKLYPFTKYDFDFLEVNQSKDLHQGLIEPYYKCEEGDLRQKINEIVPSLIVVQGDTRTAFRGALYAYELKIPVAHVEAGLRTYDINDPHPEEGYRQMIDQISTYHFCSTKEAKENLRWTSSAKDPIYVGQTSIDTLVEFIPDCIEEDFYIVTIHRTDPAKVIPELKTMDQSKLKIFAHPNKIGQELKKHFKCLEPMNYKEFVKLLARSKGCISDSGGLQEECVFLGKEYISLRDKTERGKGETYIKGATNKIMEVLNG
jgi:UDP-N-acetylglucosamine 2-epimerase (non-hydrolysing)